MRGGTPLAPLAVSFHMEINEEAPLLWSPAAVTEKLNESALVCFNLHVEADGCPTSPS